MHTCFIALAPHAITILQSGLRVRRCAVSCQDPIKYENRIKNDNNQNEIVSGAGAAFPRLSCGQFLRATITWHLYACGRRARNPAPRTPRTSATPHPPPPSEPCTTFLPHSCAGPWEPSCLDAG
ncbi:unnamed protein product, partial [Brenthis ino]